VPAIEGNKNAQSKVDNATGDKEKGSGGGSSGGGGSPAGEKEKDGGGGSGGSGGGGSPAGEKEKHGGGGSDGGDESPARSKSDRKSESTSDSSSDSSAEEVPPPPARRKAAGTAEAASTQDKVKSYLESKRREAAAEISKRMGQDMIVYNSIRASDHRSTMASDLLGGSKRMIALPPGVVEIGDGRILSGGLKVDIAERKIISASFDADWRCIACNHPSDRPAFKFIGCADSQNTPHVIILGDQAVPAVLPSETEKQCIKVLIIENGSLRELADELLKLIGNRRVPKGSAIMIFSSTFLAEAGLVAYIEEFQAISKMIKDRLGKATIVMPLPPHHTGRLRAASHHQRCVRANCLVYRLLPE
jgi:hypothetical protein